MTLICQMYCELLNLWARFSTIDLCPLCDVFVFPHSIYPNHLIHLPILAFPEILVHSIYLSSIYMYNTRFTLLTNFKMYNMLLLSCFSVTQLCLTLCSSMDCCTPGFFVRHYLSEFVQTHAHWVDGAIQPSHPLLPPFSPALNLSQHQGVFQWVSSSHQVTRVLQLQLQHQVLFCMADL